MAKDLGLISNGRKKLGNVVLQRNNVQRQRVYNIKNPKTRGQIAARVVTATMAGMVEGLKGIIDHSFETVPYGAKSINHFRKLNAKSLMAKAKEDLQKTLPDCENAFLPKGVSGCLPNEVIISQGTLPYNNEYMPFFDEDDGDDGLLKMMYECGPIDVTGMTTAEWLWEFMGLRPGSQLTWILVGGGNIVYTNSGYDEDDNFTLNRTVKKPIVKVVRLVVKEEKDFTYKNLNPQAGVGYFVANNLAGAFDYTKSSPEILRQLEDQELYTITAEDETYTMTRNYIDAVGFGGFYLGMEDEVYAAGAIRSELHAGKWLRSTSKLIATEYQRKVADRSAVQGLNIHDAIDSWLSSSLAESDRYLNEG